jgi:hypothetical protein
MVTYHCEDAKHTRALSKGHIVGSWHSYSLHSWLEFFFAENCLSVSFCRLWSDLHEILRYSVPQWKYEVCIFFVVVNSQGSYSPGTKCNRHATQEQWHYHIQRTVCDVLELQGHWCDIFFSKNQQKILYVSSLFLFLLCSMYILLAFMIFNLVCGIEVNIDLSAGLWG